MTEPFGTLHRDACPFGVLIAVSLPDVREGVSEDTLEHLHPEEREVAEGLTGHRKVSWVGGRIALRRALKVLGKTPGALLTGGHGEPILPSGFSGSISHKKDMALALVARSVNGTLGVDLEIPDSPARDIGEKILRPEEKDWVEALPPERRWPATLVVFSIKEAIYKALFPHVRRYVGFKEASVRVNLNEPCEVALHLESNERSFKAEARLHWLGDRVVATARVQPAKSTQGRSSQNP